MIPLSISQDDEFSQNFKRPRLDVKATISEGCGVVATRMKSSEVECNKFDINPPKENATMDFGHRKYPPPRILKKFPVHRDIPIGCKNQNFGDSSNLINRRLMVVTDGMKLRESEQNMVGVNPSHENATVDFSPRKYPPPRILKGFVVRRDFPVGCGNQKFGHHPDSSDGKLMGGDGMKSRENECNAIGVNILKESVLMDIVHRKYTSPKILKQFANQRDFRVGCRKKSFSHLSNSTNGKSMVDFKPLEGSNGVDFNRNKVNLNRNKVKKALQTFQDLYLKLMQEENEKNVSLKIQIKAAMLLRGQLRGIYTSKRLGPIPGVEVGDLFQWVTELNVIGLHCQFCSGIDYMKINGKALATSIICSGRYYNDVEFSDVLIYSGHGGNPTFSGNQIGDQKLERGNLALKNSMEAKTPVRVIHGFKISKSSTWIGLSGMRIFNKIYVYDGLYVVDQYWQERGQFGKLVFMFLLKRILGQPRCAFRQMSEFKNSAVEKNGISCEKYKMAIMSKEDTRLCGLY